MNRLNYSWIIHEKFKLKQRVCTEQTYDNLKNKHTYISSRFNLLVNVCLQ